MHNPYPAGGISTTASVQFVGGLTYPGAAPAKAHFANPYKAPTADLQYQSTPAATLAPAQTMPPPAPPAPVGTNTFPGPQGVLPYGKPFTNP